MNIPIKSVSSCLMRRSSYEKQPRLLNFNFRLRKSLDISDLIHSLSSHGLSLSPRITVAEQVDD